MSISGKFQNQQYNLRHVGQYKDIDLNTSDRTFIMFMNIKHKFTAQDKDKLNLELEKQTRPILRAYL